MITIFNEIILVSGVVGCGWFYNSRKTKEAGMRHAHNSAILEKSHQCSHVWKIYKVREFRTESAKNAEVGSFSYDPYAFYSYLSEYLDDVEIEEHMDDLGTTHRSTGEYIQVTTQICSKCGELNHSTFRTSV